MIQVFSLLVVFCSMAHQEQGKLLLHKQWLRSLVPTSSASMALMF